MLNAILHGKAGRVDTDAGESISWREVFRKREDLLTAVFFGRIRYLSDAGQRQILSLLVGIESATQLGSISEVVFWPRLGNLSHRSFVEPDVLLFTDQALMIVEVKPPFGGDQCIYQWQEEIDAILSQTETNPEFELPDRIHFLALGRNAPNWKGFAKAVSSEYQHAGVSIHTVEWNSVCEGIRSIANTGSGTASDLAIIGDWLDAFDLFGMLVPPRPFEEILPALQLLPETLSLISQILDSSTSSAQPARRPPDVQWSTLANFSMNHILAVNLWR